MLRTPPVVAPAVAPVPAGWVADYVSRRPLRVTALVALIVVLSLADLHLTLTFLTSGGMLESNPLARLVMSYDCAGLLTLWKCASVGLTSWILFRARRNRSAEIAAWIGVGVLLWLMVRWAGYIETADALAQAAANLDEAYLAAATDGRWVSLPARRG